MRTFSLPKPEDHKLTCCANVCYRPFFTKGCAIGCGFTGSIVIFAFALRWRLSYINKQKDTLHGPADENEQIDVTDLGEKHPSFRYFL
jgi:hypothetical protein